MDFFEYHFIIPILAVIAIIIVAIAAITRIVLKILPKSKKSNSYFKSDLEKKLSNKDSGDKK